MAKKPTIRPAWTDQPPPPGSYRSIFKLGAPDEFKHPSPAWCAMMQEVLGMTEEDFSTKRHEGNEPVRLERGSQLRGDQVERFEKIVGEENVATDDYSRVKHSHGKVVDEALDLRRKIVRHVCDAVVHPRDKQEVEEIVAYCNAEGIPIYVSGGGTSATLGIQPTRGGICLVLSTHMNKVLEINDENQTAVVQAGILGPDYEEALNRAPERFGTRHRYTCGHFPQSFPTASVGGWIAALGAGQASTYYGDAYDLVLAQEVITPAGTIRTHPYPSTATGPKVNDILKGSEGAFGVVVEVTLKIFRYMPENTRRFAFMFPSWRSAIDAAREIMQGEFGRPAVYRVSDPEETDAGLKLYGSAYGAIDKALRLRGLKPMRRCLVIGSAEGERGFARHVKRMIRKIARGHGALYLTALPEKVWEKDRYRHPLMREDVMDFGMVIDTLETAVTWDHLHRLYTTVRTHIKKRPGTLCLTHASHFYPQGTNLYFIFGMKLTDPDEFREFRNGILDRIIANGGSLSHHHGVGKLLAPWMEAHLGREQMEVLRALKRHFDPNNIMNPGGQMGIDL